MNRTSLTYFLLAALCLALMLVSCKGKNKNRVNEFHTSDMELIDSTKALKLGSVVERNIITLWADYREAKTSQMTITPIKHDTIYIYRDTCIGISFPYDPTSIYVLGVDSNGMIIEDTLPKGNGKIKLNYY